MLKHLEDGALACPIAAACILIVARNEYTSQFLQGDRLYVTEGDRILKA